jgi:F0F1-type ATP synthase epsilon subunit
MLSCQLRSPDRTLYDGDVVSVTARSPRGEFAVLATEELRFACFGGTLAMDGSRVVILGSEIIRREEIDLEAERLRAGTSPEAVARARLELLEKVARDNG